MKEEKWALRFKELISILRELDKVNSLDSKEWIEAESLAHAFLDIEESCQNLVNDFFPKLEKDKLSQDELFDLLVEIGEEFRHIMYHIRDTKFYDYLIEKD